MLRLGKINITLTRAIALGFALLILAGSLLLTLPMASRDGARIPYINALFTAASASCVTGLVVYDTYTQFTLFGQLVILTLIQIGGLGFMTVSIFLSLLLGKRIGLKQRSLLMESINSMRIGGVVRLVKRVLIGTAAFELCGAALLALRFCPMFGLGRGIYYGLFHSISAFCNAGFDLMGALEPGCSLTPFASDALVNFVVMSLIVIGGIGFIVWDDIAEHKWRFGEYMLHTKLVLLTTAALIVAPAAAFFFLESDGALSGMSAGGKALAALFQSVTLRTAGFNTIDQAALSEGGTLLSICLMFIGASPGSTGGGLKTTTFLVIIMSVVSYMRHTNDLTVFRRRLEDGLLRRAYSTAAVFLLLALAGVFIMVCGQNVTLTDASFEAVSAIGTVGITRGITRELTPISRVAVAALMFSGRVGSLTVAMAVAERQNAAHLRYPVGKITIG